MTCKIPKCYKSQKNNCSIPNPWIVFNKNHRGFTTKALKTSAYIDFKNSFNPIKTKDEQAYRASLCLYKKKPTTIIPQGSKLISKFVARLMKERKEIELGCKMTPNLIKFFEQFVPSSIVGTTTLNPCRVIAKYMLEKCVPRDQLKYYTFQDKITYGAHGLLISGTFQQKPVAIKIIPIHTHDPYKFSFTIDGHTTTLKSLSEKNVVNEFNLQKKVGEINFHSFQIPSIHSDIGIIKSRTSNNRVAVFVMDKVVGEIDMEKMSFQEQCKCVDQIPCILHKLHTKGFIHGDLHMWNLLVTRKSSYVIDFGRSINMKDTDIKDKNDLKMLKVMDYIIPLEMVLRGVDQYNYKDIGTMMIGYLDGIQICPAHKEIDTLLEQIKDGLFKIDVRLVLGSITVGHITLEDLKERYNAIKNLLFGKYYSNYAKNWYQVMKIS